MSARTLVVYSVDDSQGGTTHPTKLAAMKDARDRVRVYKAQGDDSWRHVSVTRITIVGPFNRELVCKLLSNGGYADELITIWRASDESEGGE